MSPIDQSWVVRLLRGLWKHATAPRHVRAPLLTFEMVVPPVRDGWIGRFGQWLWDGGVTAATTSRAATVISGALATIRALEPVARIAQGAAIAAIAAVTHLLLLTVVEQYHFPRRTALALPAVVVIAALLVFAMSSEIARAAADKRGE